MPNLRNSAKIASWALSSLLSRFISSSFCLLPRGRRTSFQTCALSLGLVGAPRAACHWRCALGLACGLGSPCLLAGSKDTYNLISALPRRRAKNYRNSGASCAALACLRRESNPLTQHLRDIVTDPGVAKLIQLFFFLFFSIPLCQGGTCFTLTDSPCLCAGIGRFFISNLLSNSSMYAS